MTDTNQNAELSVGIKFHLGNEAGDSFIPIPGIKNPGATGDKGTFVDATPIDAEGFKYIAALSEGEDRELSFFYYPGNAAQQQIISAAETGATRKIKIEFTKLKKSATFEMVFNGWNLPEPEFNTATMLTIFAKKNTSFKTAWEDISA